MKKNHAFEWDCLTCRSRASRREFLMGLGGVGLALLSEKAALAQANPFRIDVHHHFASPGFVAEIISRGLGNDNYRAWVPRSSLDEMDEAGTATAMISVTRPGVWFGDVAVARRLARETNEFGARLVSDYPGRFGLFATLPLPDVEGSLQEIEYAYDVLNADGIAVMSSYDDIYLGDPRIAPVMDELNRRNAIVYEHPIREDRENPMNGIELIMDTTRTITSLLASATVERCPNIRFIFAHGGGTVAASASRMGGSARELPNDLMYYLRRFFYDTGNAHAAPLLASYKALAPISQILFGTDFLGGSGNTLRTAQALRDHGGFTDAELRMIERDNALALFPRLNV